MKYSEMTPAQQKTADKLRKAASGDERVAQVSEKRLAIAGVIAVFYVVVRILYVGFRGELAVPELVLLFLMVLAMWGVDLQNGVHELPKHFGKELDPAPAARGRRIGFYALAAALLSASWTAADHFLNIFAWKAAGAYGFVTDALIGFAVFFLFNLLSGEWKVRRYNRYMQKLEAEENDLS
ncbi:MAG: hypothetical protein K6E36_08390 [Oscillospiraceae bacterium]|nr:hypothetical protein [Oscillospiraceae bacterium]